MVDQVEFPAPGEPVPPEMFNTITAYLALDKEALDCFHKADNMEPVGSLFVCSGLMNMHQPHLSSSHKAVLLLKLKMFHRSVSRDSSGAVDSLIAMAALPRLLEHDSVLLSQFVKLSAESRLLHKIPVIGWAIPEPPGSEVSASAHFGWHGLSM